MTTTEAEAGEQPQDFKQVLVEATQQLNETLTTLNDILKEAGATINPVQDDDEHVPVLSSSEATVESEPVPTISEAVVESQNGLVTILKASADEHRTWWIAGAGVAVIAIGVGFYLYRRTDGSQDGFPFGVIKHRIMTDDSSEQLSSGSDTDESMTILGRLWEATNFAGNLLLASEVVRVGENVLEYFNVESYVEAAQEKVMEMVKKPLESIQSAVDEQVHAAQESLESQIHAVQDTVQSEIEGHIESVQDVMEQARVNVDELITADTGSDQGSPLADQSENTQ